MTVPIGCLLIALAALFSPLSHAQPAGYPVKPIRIITPFPPGATTDALSRIIGQKMQESWGQNVLADNRPGATGLVGTELAAKAPPDGYTFVNVISSHVVHKHPYKKVPFDALKDFEPVILLARVTNVLIVHPSLPARNVREFIALAKARKGSFVYGSAGAGSSNHLSAEMFKQAAGIEMEHVPYKGGAPAASDLIGGQIPVMMASLLTGAPHVRAGKAKALLRSPGCHGRTQVWERVLARVRRTWGGLHVLVNNAGVVSRSGVRVACGCAMSCLGDTAPPASPTPVGGELPFSA